MATGALISGVGLLLACFSLQAQTDALEKGLTGAYVTHAIGAKEGLPSSEIFSLIQDSRGMVWIGTSIGLSRFDGVSFDNFLVCGGRQLGKTHRIKEDTLHEVLWIMSDAGLCFFRYDSLHAVNFENGFTGIYEISIDENHNYWLATAKGVAFMPKDTMRALIEKGIGNIERHILPGWRQLSENEVAVKLVVVNRSDDVWACTRKKLYHFDGNILQEQWQLKLPDDNILSAEVSQQGEMYFTTALSGLYKGSKGKITAIYKGKSFSADLFRRDSTLYYFNREGIYKMSADTLCRISTVPAAHNRWISCIMADREQNLWIGMHHVLLFQQKKLFYSLPHYSGMFSAARLENGEIIMGSEGGKIYRKGRSGVFSIKTKLPTMADITAIYEDKRGWVWYATGYDGVFIKRASGIIQLTEKDGLGALENYFFEEDAEGNIWTGGDGAVTKIAIDNAGSTIRCRKYMAGIEGDNWFTFLSMFPGPGGCKWFAGARGLYTLQNDTLTSFRFPHSLSVPNISGVATDDHNGIWLSTKGEGLWHCSFNRNGTLSLKRKIGTADGMHSNILLDVAADAGGAIWVAGYSGISRIINNGSDYLVSNYSERHGFSGIDYQSAKFFREDDAATWVMTSSGVYYFDPRSFNNAITAPGLLLNNVSTKDSTVYADGKQLTKALSLPYRNNDIVFRFSGLYYSYPENLHYLYRLSGTDSNWTDNGSNGQISFQRLEPGEYTLEAKARLGGVKESQPVIFAFSIKPPFWARWWFAATAGILLLATAVYMISRREKSVKEKAAQENEVRRKIDQLEVKALRSQMNPHFIFNSLNSIAQLVASDQKEKGLDYLTKFSKLMRMILDDADQSMHTLRDEIRVLDLYLQLESLRFGQTFSYNIYADEALSPEEMQIPALLVQPLIENAVWHGLLHKNGARRLDVHFKKNGKNTLLCVVEDNGIGFGQALAMKDQRMNGEMQRPRGLQLVSDRLRMLENEYHVTCYCSVGEQHDEHGKITGTKATLQFPFLYEN